MALTMILAGGLGWTGGATGQSASYEQEPIAYLTAPVDDPVARLQKKLDRGEQTLRFDERHGYLPAVLEALGVDPDSQVLVFSKTSFQRERIGPRTPRALYFNDEVYVGWVQGGEVLELSSADPRQGGVFYLLEQQSGEKPAFLRQTHDCLQCHASGKTQDVPGHVVRSVYPLKSGQPAFNAGTFTTSHESPLSERWGGWYVTGKHGHQTHMGNLFATDPEHPERLDLETGANLTDLAKFFKTDRYLRPTSDLVALMVMEHQTQVQNLITAAGYQCRIALKYQEGIEKALGTPTGELLPSTVSRIKGPSEKLLKALLFCGEAELTEPVAGTSKFAEHFAAKGRRDPQGRSLRDFDLTRRMFRYPCSYLIESEAFDNLPAQVRDQVARRLDEVLSGRDQSPDFAALSAADRQAIRAILQATKPALTAGWK